MLDQLALPLDLQLFAEGDVIAGDGNSSEPIQGTPNWGLPNQGTSNQSEPMQNPLLSQSPVVPSAPVVPEPTPQEFLDFAGRKVPVVDPVVKDIHQDYMNMQKTFTQSSQRIKELESQNQAYQTMVQQFQQPVAQQPQPTPEQLEKAKEEFMEKFYDDPMGAIEKLLEQKVESKVKPALDPLMKSIDPIVKEREFSNQVQQLSQKYSDFQSMTSHMEQVLQEMPNLAQQGLETVYMIAKGRAAQTAQPAPTPEQMMQDPNFVNQYVMNNPQIQQQMISQYLQQKQGTQAPPVMGNQPGGIAPSMPEKKPQTLSEGSKFFSRYLGLGG